MGGLPYGLARPSKRHAAFVDWISPHAARAATLATSLSSKRPCSVSMAAHRSKNKLRRTVGAILHKIKPEPSAAWGWPGREETPARPLRRPLPRDEKLARHVEPVARIHSRGWSRRQWPCQPCREAVARQTVGPIRGSALRCRSI